MSQSKLSLPVLIDARGQILTTLRVAIGKSTADVYFKIDTGCNVVLLSHSSLEELGIQTSADALRKLPPVSATIGDGSMADFRIVGDVNLFSGKTHICAVKAICHTTQKTRNLLGTSVLHKFSRYIVQVRGTTYLELIN